MSKKNFKIHEPEKPVRITDQIAEAKARGLAAGFKEPPALEWPVAGKLRISTWAGVFSDCGLASVSSLQELQDWHDENPFMCIMHFVEPGFPTCFYYRAIVADPEIQKDIEAVQHDINWFLKERREEREAQAVKELEIRNEAERELKRLIAVGEHCENNHGKKAGK